MSFRWLRSCSRLVLLCERSCMTKLMFQSFTVPAVDTLIQDARLPNAATRNSQWRNSGECVAHTVPWFRRSWSRLQHTYHARSGPSVSARPRSCSRPSAVASATLRSRSTRRRRSCSRRSTRPPSAVNLCRYWLASHNFGASVSQRGHTSRHVGPSAPSALV